MPEVRVDPLTGLKSIVTPERATRPGGGLSRRAMPADRPRDRPVRSKATRTARRPRSTRCGRTAAHRTRPAGRFASSRTSTRRSTPRAPRRRRSRKHDLFTATPATRRATRSSSTRRDPVPSLADLDVEQVEAAVGRLARAHARARRARRLRPRHRQRAPRGRRLAAPHARADLRARLRPRRGRPRARALRRVRPADDGRQPAQRPRAGGGQAQRARSSRSTTRRSSWSPTARASLPAHARAAPAARALRRRRPDRRGAPARRAAPPRAPPGREPAAEPLGPHRAARRRALLLAHRHRARASPTWPASSSATGVHLNIVAPERAAAELRDA